jgi:hypothetical protein
MDDQREPAQADWLRPALRDALERGPRGGLHLRLDMTGMTDTATGEPSIVLNGRPIRPFHVKWLLGAVGVEPCALLDAER